MESIQVFACTLEENFLIYGKRDDGAGDVRKKTPMGGGDGEVAAKAEAAGWGRPTTEPWPPRDDLSSDDEWNWRGGFQL